MSKKLTYILLVCFSVFTADAQYYLRGEIKNEKEQPLVNVKIFLHSTRHLYFSGNSGGFGITSNVLDDSISVSLEGYESKTMRVKADQWQNIVLKVLPSIINHNRPKLISIIKDRERSNRFKWHVDDETYFQLVENESVVAKEYPNTGFALNVNKASYSNVRRFLNMGSKVPPDAVRTEEFLNYFNLGYKEPRAPDVFSIRSQLTSCPWSEGKYLLYLNIDAKKVDMDKVPPGNFVFLIDASGSMDMPNRLPLLKAAFQMFVKNLRAKDTVSIVAYGGTVGIWLQPTSGAEKEKIIRSIEELEAVGDTPGEAAIMTAYKLAESTFIKNGNNRVILATDGDFNVGLTSEKALEELITKEKQTGVYLTCLGVGMGNFKDSKLETLAKKGNGNYAYLDDLKEAEKVLVKELTQTLFAVADDAFLNLQFDPRLVKEYRLVGFDNKKDAVVDSSIELEGGEIGSGASVVAIFEITPEDEKLFSPSMPIRGPLASLSIRYSSCNDTIHKTIRYDCANNFVEFNSMEKELQFAAAVAMFSLKLKRSKYMRNVDWADIETIATDPNDHFQTDLLRLIEKAKKIYVPKKTRKKKGSAD